MKKALIGLMVLAIISWGSSQLFAIYNGDKGQTDTGKGKNEQVNPGDNKDDQHSGKPDRIGDGNSGQGDDKKADKKIPPGIIKKYDKDGDGKLNDAERAQWKADRDARHGETTGKKTDDKWRDNDFDEDRPGDDGWVRRLIGRYDKDGDGKLNEQELARFRNERAKYRVEMQMLKKYDKDHDGKLNDAEKAQMKADRETERKARQAEILKKYDKDGDGKLNDAEKAQMKADQTARRDENEANFFKRWDKDGDKALDAQELAKYIKATSPKRKVNFSRLVKMWDKNGDGKLSPEEREAARKWYNDHPNDKEAQQEWKEWEGKHSNNGVRDHGKGEGRMGNGQGKGQGQGPDKKKK